MLDLVIRPTLGLLLPERMRTPMAEVMLLAIALQETNLEHRFQVRGPARGWWQFERGGGFAGVLEHRASEEHASRIVDALVVDHGKIATDLWGVLPYNDALACAFARLLLWTIPRPLPAGKVDEDEAWRQYLDAWRPGRPHPAFWTTNWETAWEAVER